MYYHQKQYSLYNPALTRLSIGSSNLVVNYVDSFDESCVEFNHVHTDCYEIYHCLEGTHHLVIGDETYTLTQGCFALLRPNVYHNTVYEPQKHKRYTAFVFTKPSSNAAKDKQRGAQPEDTFLSDALQYFDTHTHYIGRDAHGCSGILDRLHEEIIGSLPGKKLMIDTLYQQYILSILRCMTEMDSMSESQTAPPLSNLNMAIMMTKYMHKNYYKNITIQDISNEFFISARHVNRVFENYFGQSFKKTLNIYRLNYAKNYLYDTDYSIEKISQLVGLASPKALYQLFKEVEGMTVAEFCQTCPNRKRTSPPPAEPSTDEQ
ncbi:MAG: AraC family transcriptional regulator [Eubacteriales bacterium]|nr:AraC family transcriptional regulator [Eubacteriales bacterium]